MSAYLFVCLSVSLSVYLSKKVICSWPVTYIGYVTALAYNIIFSETSPSQNNSNWSTQRKYVVVTFDHPGSSGGERVYPVFQGL